MSERNSAFLPPGGLRLTLMVFAVVPGIVMPTAIRLALRFGIPAIPSIWRGIAERARHTVFPPFLKGI